MRAGKTVFSQVIERVHPEQFRRCVQRYGGNERIRHFPCWEQFLAMAFAQLTCRDSLSDIETCLRSRPDQLYHRGFGSRVAHSTLADANRSRDWRIYHDLAQTLIARARRLYADDYCRRETAVASVAGEEWMIAQIFLMPYTIRTDATGLTEPWNSNSLTQTQPIDASPNQINPTDDFVAWNDWNFWVGKFAIHDMHIRATHAAGRHLHSNLARPGLRIGKFRPFQRSTNFFQHHRVHGVLQFRRRTSSNAV
jgi:hypothetical protein